MRIILGFFSIITTFISGIMVNFENDLKKIIALSIYKSVKVDNNDFKFWV